MGESKKRSGKDPGDGHSDRKKKKRGCRVELSLCSVTLTVLIGAHLLCLYQIMTLNAEIVRERSRLAPAREQFDFVIAVDANVQVPQPVHTVMNGILGSRKSHVKLLGQRRDDGYLDGVGRSHASHGTLQHSNARSEAAQHWQQAESVLQHDRGHGDAADTATPDVWDAVDKYLCSQACTTASYDVVIVGAGVSGLYAAWRLKQSDPSARIAVLEATERTGGRLFSVPIPGMPDIRADVGGMHYLSKPDAMLNAWLVEKYFNLSNRAFAQNSSDPKSSAFLRNTHITGDQLRNIDTVGKFYQFTDADRRLFGDFLTIYSKLYNATIAGFMDDDFDAWSASTVDGRKLYDVTSRDLEDIVNMSSEMRDFMAASSGYNGGPQARHSCITLVDMMKSVLLGQFSNYRVPTGGMQALPNRLRYEFIKLGGEVYTNMPVTGMANCSSGSAAEHHQALLTAAGKPFCSKSVILALHEGALEKLWWRTLSMETAWKAAIPGEASKLFLGFDKPWWREAPFGFYEGAEVSSLDIEHTYFIGTQADHVSANTSTGQSNRNSLVLASYTLAYPAYRWADMEATKANISAFQGRANAFVGSETPMVPNATGFTVSKRMVDLAMQQLHQLHNVNAGTIPPPYTAAAIHWPVSWHAWSVGASPSEVIRKVGQLDAYQNVFMCGEAYSKSQGWAEGALRSAEYILEEYFNLKPLAGMPTKWLSRYR